LTPKHCFEDEFLRDDLKEAASGTDDDGEPFELVDQVFKTQLG
jgi:hypothetical protein